MRPALALLLIIAILLTACNLPFGGSDEPDVTTPDAAQPPPPKAPDDTTEAPSGSLIFMPQQMQSGSASTGIATLTYFWPDPIPQGLTVDKERSYADGTGYSVEMFGETVGVQIMGGDTAALAWDMVVEKNIQMETRGQPAYAFETEGGVSVHWTENGNFYLVSGMGMDVSEVQAIINSLIATDQGGFQVRVAQ